MFVNNRAISSLDALGLYEVYFEIVTTIKQTHGILVNALVLGEKTRHWAVVETETGKIVRRGDATGSTFGLPGLSAYTEIAGKSSSCSVIVSMSGFGQTAADPFYDSIDWDFTFEIEVPTHRVRIKNSKHDGFPSYDVRYGAKSYNFVELTPDRLNPPMEIEVEDTDDVGTD